MTGWIQPTQRQQQRFHSCYLKPLTPCRCSKHWSVSGFGSGWKPPKQMAKRCGRKMPRQQLLLG
jgi:hypothetical protein